MYYFLFINWLRRDVTSLFKVELERNLHIYTPVINNLKEMLLEDKQHLFWIIKADMLVSQVSMCREHLQSNNEAKSLHTNRRGPVGPHFVKMCF